MPNKRPEPTQYRMELPATVISPPKIQVSSQEEHSPNVIVEQHGENAINSHDETADDIPKSMFQNISILKYIKFDRRKYYLTLVFLRLNLISKF